MGRGEGTVVADELSRLDFQSLSASVPPVLRGLVAEGKARVAVSHETTTVAAVAALSRLNTSRCSADAGAGRPPADPRRSRRGRAAGRGHRLSPLARPPRRAGKSSGADDPDRRTRVRRGRHRPAPVYGAASRRAGGADHAVGTGLDSAPARRSLVARAVTRSHLARGLRPSRGAGLARGRACRARASSRAARRRSSPTLAPALSMTSVRTG